MKSRALGAADIVRTHEEPEIDRLRDDAFSFSNNHNYLRHFNKSWFIPRREKEMSRKTAMELLEDPLMYQ